MILSQFQAVGRDLFTKGLISSTSGNLSIRLGERLIITRRSSGLGSLLEHDLIETGISKTRPQYTAGVNRTGCPPCYLSGDADISRCSCPPTACCCPVTNGNRDCAY
jgi:hypothetical protein